jgi:hypothetical protein
MSRHGKRWTVNEILTLQREYELLQLSVEEIAMRHERSQEAIRMKLDYENFTNEEEHDYQNVPLALAVDSIGTTNVESHDVRIYRLEHTIKELTNIVGEMVKQNNFCPNKANKLDF